MFWDNMPKKIDLKTHKHKGLFPQMEVMPFVIIAANLMIFLSIAIAG